MCGEDRYFSLFQKKVLGVGSPKVKVSPPDPSYQPTHPVSVALHPSLRGRSEPRLGISLVVQWQIHFDIWQN